MQLPDTSHRLILRNIVDHHFKQSCEHPAHDAVFQSRLDLCTHRMPQLRHMIFKLMRTVDFTLRQLVEQVLILRAGGGSKEQFECGQVAVHIFHHLHHALASDVTHMFPLFLFIHLPE